MQLVWHHLRAFYGSNMSGHCERRAQFLVLLTFSPLPRVPYLNNKCSTIIYHVISIAGIRINHYTLIIYLDGIFFGFIKPSIIIKKPNNSYLWKITLFNICGIIFLREGLLQINQSFQLTRKKHEINVWKIAHLSSIYFRLRIITFTVIFILLCKNFYYRLNLLTVQM